VYTWCKLPASDLHLCIISVILWLCCICVLMVVWLVPYPMVTSTNFGSMECNVCMYVYCTEYALYVCEFCVQLTDCLCTLKFISCLKLSCFGRCYLCLGHIEFKSYLGRHWHFQLCLLDLLSGCQDSTLK
jgi:hypothetical protein